MSGSFQCHPLKRVRYFAGQIITPEDMAEEQRYFREKARRHNSSLHGFGVVDGLEVVSKKRTLRVSPGFALDCAGNEIAVCEAVELQEPKDGAELYVVLSYQEVETDPVPLTGSGTTAAEMQNSRIEEGYEVQFEKNDPCADHGGGKSGWHPCGEAHGVTLARLVRGRNKWKVDRDYKQPRAH